MKPGVLVVNFGGPRASDELEPFLRALLTDVLPGPGWVKRAAAGWLAPRRAARVLPRYERIGWSPGTPDTQAQAAAIAARTGLPVAAGMMFTTPSVQDALRQLLDDGVDTVLVAGLFPHWAFATSGAAGDMAHDALAALGREGIRLVHLRPFFDDPAWVAVMADAVRGTRVDGDGPLHLLFTAHGIPLSQVHDGDPYPDQVRASVRAIVEALRWKGPWHLSWQSRLGPTRWLSPSTVDTVKRLGAQGVTRLLVVPVSFVGEHIETTHELDIEVREDAAHAGITHWGRAPVPGLTEPFYDALAAWVRRGLDQLGRPTCVRCLVPVEPVHHKAVCPTCRFKPPRHLRDVA